MMAKIVERTWRGADGTERRGWQVDFTDQSGKRQRRQFQRRKDADAFMVTARGQVQVGTYTPDSTSATIGEACDLWLERAVAEGLERNTQRYYGHQVAHVLAAIAGGTRLSRITRARAEQVRDDLLKAHSRHTATKALKVFKAVLKDALRRGLVAQNVAADTSIGAAKRHRAKLKAGVDFPLPTEIKAMIDHADPKARAVVCLAGLAGLRASEIRALKWSDLDPGAKPAVTVSARADTWCAVGSPKSESSRRSVPLGEGAVKALKEWRLAQPPGRTLVFGTGTDRPDRLENIQRRLLDPLMAKAGVRQYSIHKLRHYAISSWLAAGSIDLKTVQHWAGHATLALTLDTYGHLLPRADDHARIADAERALSG